MSIRALFERRLGDAFVSTDSTRLAKFGSFYGGKVRDLYIGSKEIIMVTTDRLSAFDVVLTSIPGKGAILNAITTAAFAQTDHICPNHLIEAPHPNVLRVRKATPVAAEIIVRRYITGSLWRDYQKGHAGVYEVDLARGLRRDQRFDEPIITPSTKAPVGEHDQPISCRALVQEGLVAAPVLHEALDKAMELFRFAERQASVRGLILVDTKYEFGQVDGQLVLIDEIHTADSSRYWIANEYKSRFDAGKPQRMLT